MGKEKENPVKVVEKLRIRKKGTFDYKRVHGRISSFFLKMGYTFAETKHEEKEKDSGKEIKSEWSGFRKVTNYVKFKVSISILLRDYKEVTVEEDGRKMGTGLGRLEVTFNADMEKNYGKMFSERKGEFTNFLKELYEKYLVEKKLKDYEDKLEAEVLGLYDDIKGMVE